MNPRSTDCEVDALTTTSSCRLKRGETYPSRTEKELTDRKLLLDLADGNAWPFLVRGAIRLVDSNNERDSNLLVVRSAHARVPGSCRPGARATKRRGQARMKRNSEFSERKIFCLEEMITSLPTSKSTEKRQGRGP